MEKKGMKPLNTTVDNEVFTLFEYKCDLLGVNRAYLLRKIIIEWLVEQGALEPNRAEEIPI